MDCSSQLQSASKPSDTPVVVDVTGTKAKMRTLTLAELTVQSTMVQQQLQTTLSTIIKLNGARAGADPVAQVAPVAGGMAPVVEEQDAAAAPREDASAKARMALLAKSYRENDNKRRQLDAKVGANTSLFKARVALFFLVARVGNGALRE